MRGRLSLRLSLPVLGIVFALLSILAIASGDIVAKYMSYQISVIQILWVRFLVHFALGLAMTNWRRFPVGLATARPGLQIARGLLLIGSTYAFVLALHYLPFVDALAIGFVSPVIISLLAATVLKEKMDALGVECVVRLREELPEELSEEEVRDRFYHEQAAFVKRHFGVEGS